MKKLLLLFLFAIAIAACTSSPEKKAQKAIKEYLFKTLNDIDSYEPVEYGTIDSLYTDYTMDSLYQKAVELNNVSIKMRDSIKKIWERRKIYNEFEFNPDEVNNLYTATMFVEYTYPRIIDSLKNNYQSYFMGMGMIHSFRAKNTLGSNILCKWQFIFSPDFESVLSTINLEKESPIMNYTKIENGNEKREKEKKMMEIKYAKEKAKHDTFLDSISNIKDVEKQKNGDYFEIVKIGNGKLYKKQDKVKFEVREFNESSRKTDTKIENRLKYGQSIFYSRSLPQGSIIRIHTPYNYEYAKDRNPYEISITEITLL